MLMYIGQKYLIGLLTLTDVYYTNFLRDQLNELLKDFTRNEACSSCTLMSRFNLII